MGTWSKAKWDAYWKTLKEVQRLWAEFHKEYPPE